MSKNSGALRSVVALKLGTDGVDGFILEGVWVDLGRIMLLVSPQISGAVSGSPCPLKALVTDYRAEGIIVDGSTVERDEQRLADIMPGISDARYPRLLSGHCHECGTRDDYVARANIAGFTQVADAMLAFRRSGLADSASCGWHVTAVGVLAVSLASRAVIWLRFVSTFVSIRPQSVRPPPSGCVSKPERPTDAGRPAALIRLEPMDQSAREYQHGTTKLSDHRAAVLGHCG
jgi:hypothetical protein